MPSVTVSDISTRRTAWREDFERVSGIVATLKGWEFNIRKANIGADKKPFADLAEEEFGRIVKAIEGRVHQRVESQKEGEHQPNFYIKEAEFLSGIADQLVLAINPIFKQFEVDTLPYVLELLDRANKRLEAIGTEDHGEYYSYLSLRWAVSASILEKKLEIMMPSATDIIEYSDKIEDCYNKAFEYAERELERKSKDGKSSRSELELWFDTAMRYAGKSGKSKEELEQVRQELNRVESGRISGGVPSNSAAALIR